MKRKCPRFSFDGWSESGQDSPPLFEPLSRVWPCARGSASMALRWNELDDGGDDLPPTPGDWRVEVFPHCFKHRSQRPDRNCIHSTTQQLAVHWSLHEHLDDGQPPLHRVCESACLGRISGRCRAPMRLTSRKTMVMQAMRVPSHKASSLVMESKSQKV